MNIIVLAGGLSMERDVSLKSGAMIARALRENGHNAVLIDSFFGYTGEYSDPSEIFTKPQDTVSAEISSETPDLEALKAKRGDGSSSRVGANLLEVCRAADLVFLGLHGADGEDGRLQAMFDIAGIRYTGTGHLGSAVAMNKEAAKKLFHANGIPTPEGRLINIRDEDKSCPFLPCVVKPKSNGSSVGTSIAHSEAEYADALKLAFNYEDDVICERYIKGREIDVGVIDGKALPPIEIRPKSGFFDYRNKYQDGCTDEICPCDIPEEIDRRLRDLAERVYRALYLDVYARMDFIWEVDSGSIYCLEANTLPGMTPASLLPKEAAASGTDYSRLCETIVSLSLKKYE